MAGIATLKAKVVDYYPRWKVALIVLAAAVGAGLRAGAGTTVLVGEFLGVLAALAAYTAVVTYLYRVLSGIFERYRGEEQSEAAG